MDTRLIIIAIANVLLWVGLFLALTFSLMRGNRELNDRLEKMEARQKIDRPG